MPVTITLLRHGETTANAAHLWQGHTDAPLTPLGVDQVRLLADRIRRRRFDLATSSDLGRAATTAEAVNLSFESDQAWREADVGRWEGLTREEIFEKYPEEILALRNGEAVSMGGGETFSEFTARIDDALDKLLARLDDGQRALVVAHGGVIAAAVSGVLGLRDRSRPWPLSRSRNTSMTTIEVGEDGQRRLVVYNDAAHLGEPNLDSARDGAVVTVIRHPETAANVDGRWQGTTDGPLTPKGQQQASLLAEWVGPFDIVYSSHLQRASKPAALLARRFGVEHRERPDLGEIDFGSWEDHSPAEIAVRWPDEWQSIYVEGNDAPLGRTGESFADVRGRMEAGVRDLLASHPDGGRIGVMSHGGAILWLVVGLLGLDFVTRRSLAIPENTGTSTLFEAGGALVLDTYNVTAHLEM